MKSLILLAGALLALTALGCSRDATPPSTEQGPLLAESQAFDTAPVPQASVSPDYPEASRRAGDSGRTDVEVTIDAAGLVQNARVIRSSGHPELDDAAVAAALRWTFEPAQKEGQPVGCTVVLPFDFQLH